MRFYSDTLKKIFDSSEDLETAEREFAEKQTKEELERKKLSEERKAMAEQIESAYKDVETAKKQYNKLINDFIKKFGSYHCTISSIEDYVNDAFDSFFRFF